jgi:cytochrome c-type biogenesis protein
MTAPARRRTVLGTVLFVLGFAAVFTSYGAAFGAAFGAAVTALLVHQDTVTRILGVVTIALGVMFAGVLTRIPLAGRTCGSDTGPNNGSPWPTKAPRLRPGRRVG